MSECFEEQKNVLTLLRIESSNGYTYTNTQARKVRKYGDAKYSTLARRITRQSMYAQRNIEGRWRKHCSRGKVLSITYSECVFVALLIRHAKRKRVSYYHVWPLRLTIFSTLFGNISHTIERDMVKNVY
jgi:hypothetical protein